MQGRWGEVAFTVRWVDGVKCSCDVRSFEWIEDDNRAVWTNRVEWLPDPIPYKVSMSEPSWGGTHITMEGITNAEVPHTVTLKWGKEEIMKNVCSAEITTLRFVNAAIFPDAMLFPKVTSLHFENMMEESLNIPFRQFPSLQKVTVMNSYTSLPRDAPVSEVVTDRMSIFQYPTKLTKLVYLAHLRDWDQCETTIETEELWWVGSGCGTRWDEKMTLTLTGGILHVGGCGTTIPSEITNQVTQLYIHKGMKWFKKRYPQQWSKLKQTILVNEPCNY